MRRVLIPVLALISVVLVAVSVVFDLTIHPASEPYEVWTNALMASTWIAGGLVAWSRRPDNRCGPLMSLVGWTTLVPRLSLYEPISYTITQALGFNVAFIVHLLIVFPGGRLQTRFERVVVGVNYAGWIVLPVLGTMWAPNGCSDCPENLLFIRDEPRVMAVLVPCFIGLVVFAAVSVVVLLVQRWARASRPGRRAIALVLWTSLATLVIWAAWLVPTLWLGLAADNAYYVSLSITTSVAGSVVPLAFLAGLLRTHLHRGAVAELVVELDRAPARGSPEAAIVRALGDPGARLGFWLPEQRRYVDFDGQPIRLPTADGEQAVKLLESGGSPLAALVYDPALLEDPTMLDAVGSAARLSLENARLHAQLRAQLAEVRASRARIVEAGDAERRKIERNLHDGAQQRLLGIRLALRMARSEVDDIQAMHALLDEADTEVAATLDELRRLARGIHPVVLEEAGLRPALAYLTRRCPIPVALAAVEERLPGPIEAAAYFVISEALTNVIKHAHAQTATVDVAREDGRLIVDITDDGIGGASVDRGTGLRNLQDRVAVLSGTLTVHSDPGRGTHIQAVIPCG